MGTCNIHISILYIRKGTAIKGKPELCLYSVANIGNLAPELLKICNFPSNFKCIGVCADEGATVFVSMAPITEKSF